MIFVSRFSLREDKINLKDLLISAFQKYEKNFETSNLLQTDGSSD